MKALVEIASTNFGSIKSTCSNPFPIPPPVVGLQRPAASPNTATRSITGLWIMPEGTGPQYLPTSLQLENLPFHCEDFINTCNKSSQDSPPNLFGKDQFPILVVLPEGIAQAKNPGANSSPVKRSSLPSSPGYPVTSIWNPINNSFGRPILKVLRTQE